MMSEAAECEWRDVVLEEIVAPLRNAIVGGPFGSDLISSDYVPVGVPVIRGENLSAGRWVSGEFVHVSPDKAEKLSANTAGPLDLVFTQRGANHYRQVAIVPRDTVQRFVVSQSQMKVTVDKRKADPLFVYYVFRCPEQQEYLQRNAIQTGVPHTNLSILRKVPFRLPSLSTQMSIVQILGAIDDKIELNKRMNQTLEAMARAIFKDWFVDFGPVRAKAEGRQPPGLAPDIVALFPDALDDEDKPVGWAPVTLATFANLNPESWSAGTHPAQVEYADLSNTKWGRIEATQHFQWSDAPSRAQRVLRPGDTIVGTVRPGNGSYALVSRGGLTGSTGFAVLRAKVNSARELVYLAATARDNIDRLAHLADGAAYPAVRPDVVLATEVINVPLTVTEAFSNLVAPLLERMGHNDAESDTLAALRDLLLPKLMSGEIRIRDAEKAVKAAA